MKTDVYGTVFWTKLYDSLNHQVRSNINYYDLIELKDGSILLAGITNTDNTNGIEGDFILTKTDNTGNIIWNKIYTSRLWGTGFRDHFAVQQMKEDPLNGDIYITGSNRSQGYNMMLKCMYRTSLKEEPISLLLPLCFQKYICLWVN